MALALDPKMPAPMQGPGSATDRWPEISPRWLRRFAVVPVRVLGMKTSLKSLTLIAAALSAFAFTPLSATPKTHAAIAYRVSEVHPLDNPSVSLGASRTQVVDFMGEPNWKITPDIWAYYRYHAVDVAQADHDGCSTILVTFTGRTVSDLKLANKGALKIYEATPKARLMELLASSK